MTFTYFDTVTRKLKRVVIAFLGSNFALSQRILLEKEERYGS